MKVKSKLGVDISEVMPDSFDQKQDEEKNKSKKKKKISKLIEVTPIVVGKENLNENQ